MFLPKDQTSDLLLYLQKLKTSGGDHFTGNLTPDELVYWSSNTYLQNTHQVNSVYPLTCFKRDSSPKKTKKDLWIILNNQVMYPFKSSFIIVERRLMPLQPITHTKI